MRGLLSALVAIGMILSFQTSLWARNECKTNDLKCFKRTRVTEERLVGFYEGIVEEVINRVDDPLMHTQLRSMNSACGQSIEMDESLFLPDAEIEKISYEIGELKKKRMCYQDILIDHFIIDLSLETIMDSLVDEFWNLTKPAKK